MDKDLHYQSLMLSLPVAFYTCDMDGYITFFNDSALKLWGRTPVLGEDQWCGSWKIYYADGTSMPLSECPMAKVLKGDKISEDQQILIETPDHIFRNLLVFPVPILNNGQLVGAHNTLVDISSYKKETDKQTILSSIVASSQDAIISKNLAGIITSWNFGAERIFGYKEAEALGKPIQMLIPIRLISEETQIINSIKSGKTIDHYQTLRQHKSGTEIPVSITVSPIKNDKEQVIGASKIARDITDQLQKEKLINQHTQNLGILNSIGKIISEKLDVQSILQQVTDATTSVTGAKFGAFFYNTISDKGESFMLFTLSGAPREAFEKFGMPRNTAIFHPTFSGARSVRVDDITKDPAYGKSAPHYGMPKGHLPVKSYLAVPVISGSGEVLGGLFFGHPDVGVFTAQHEDMVISIASQAAVALDNSKLFEEVKALSAKKDEFIALASHELRTPLTSIKGYIQLLKKTQGAAQDNPLIEKTLNQVNKLNALVIDLFDISRIEAGKMQLSFEQVDLSALLSEVVESFHDSDSLHDFCFEDTTDPTYIEADAHRIEQVFVNLLGNAVKYSPEETRIITKLSVLGNQAVIAIKDMGVGLTIEQQKQVFLRFYRAEGTGNISGLGLGLYLSKEIVERHNGVISVNSEPEKGSEFIVTIPLKQEQLS